MAECASNTLGHFCLFGSERYRRFARRFSQRSRVAMAWFSRPFARISSAHARFSGEGTTPSTALATASMKNVETPICLCRYPEQLAFYREVFKAASGGVAPDTYIIGIEKREPYRCGVWKLTDGLLDQSAATNQMAMSLLKECRRRNEWPTGYEELRVFDTI